MVDVVILLVLTKRYLQSEFDIMHDLSHLVARKLCFIIKCTNDKIHNTVNARLFICREIRQTAFDI